MATPRPAVADLNWIDSPTDLYLACGDQVEIDRPIYQGDVFVNVRIPRLPNTPPDSDSAVISFITGAVMILPHPCQCYHGDTLRKRLTVAPVNEVASYDNFRPDRTGAKDKFALIDLPVPGTSAGEWDTKSFVADFGQLFTVPSRWLDLHHRVACLSHQGLGLLAKRLLGFQLRCPVTLEAAMTYTHAEFIEAQLMQAWVRENRSLRGYSEWLREPIAIPGVGAPGELVSPYEVRAAAPDALLELISGQASEEPDPSAD